MRKFIAVAIAATALSLVTTSISAQEVEPTAELNLPRIEAIFERLLNEKFASAILMTDKECNSFGTAWRPYRPISGRFALAAGRGRDDRGKTMDFLLGVEGGEYRHQLTVPEMPAHTHDYKDTHSSQIRADYGDDEPGALHDSRRETEPRGAGQPHNNMPPYLALNFCHIP